MIRFPVQEVNQWKWLRAKIHEKKLAFLYGVCYLRYEVEDRSVIIPQEAHRCTAEVCRFASIFGAGNNQNAGALSVSCIRTSEKG